MKVSENLLKGQKVTCLVEQESYYSNYGPNKGTRIVFHPGMIGTVAAITPKVLLPKHGVPLPPGIDRHDEFVVVDFLDENGQEQRAGLNFCNIKLVECSQHETN